MVEWCVMAKENRATQTRIKIGGVEVVLRPQPQKGHLSEASLRNAVSKAISSESSSGKK